MWGKALGKRKVIEKVAGTKQRTSDKIYYVKYGVRGNVFRSYAVWVFRGLTLLLPLVAIMNRSGNLKWPLLISLLFLSP